MERRPEKTRRGGPRGSHALAALIPTLLTALLGAAPLQASTPSDTTDTEGTGTTPPGWRLTPEAALYADGLRLLRGATHATSGVQILGSVGMSAELGSLLADAPLRAWVQLVAIDGSGFADAAGDVQGISNIEAASSWRIYQAWVEQGLGDGRVTILVGLYDLNSEFYVTEASGLFLNASQGIGPEFAFAGTAGPSIYPATSLALRGAWEVDERLSLRAAVLDGVPGAAGHPETAGVALSMADGALLVSEASLTLGAFGDGAPGVRATLGTWGFTGRQEEVAAPASSTSRARRANQGRYALLEAALPGCTADASCVRVFARGGMSDPRFNVAAAGWQAGATWTPSPEGVTLGAAVARAEAGSAWRRARSQAGERVAAGETNVELTARVPVVDWLSVQPDLQYVLDPGMDAERTHVLAGALRLALSF